VRGGGGEVGIVGASEGPEVMIRRGSAIESEEGVLMFSVLVGRQFDEVGGGGKRINPLGGAWMLGRAWCE